MRTLILGGMKSGKSRLAESFAEQHGAPVTLLATATADDTEMAVRIQKHQQSRPPGWRTLEEPVAIGSLLKEVDSHSSCVVLDCITLWLTNLMMHPDKALLEDQKSSLLNAVQSFQGRLIIVSNETSMGIVPLGDLSRRFCDEAGLMHQALAAECDTVILTVAGLPHYLKGEAT